MNDLIEELRQNEKPFGLNTKEEQECFEKAGRDNCDIYDPTAQGGRKDWRKPLNSYFLKERTYRISPDYQPEPEVERCEVGEFSENGKGVLMYFRGTDQKFLTEALNDPDFMWFEYEPYTKSAFCCRMTISDKPAQWPKYVVFKNRGTEAK